MGMINRQWLKFVMATGSEYWNRLSNAEKFQVAGFLSQVGLLG